MVFSLIVGRNTDLQDCRFTTPFETVLSGQSVPD